MIGGGVIGLELGSVWNRLGSEVTILEAMDRFLFMADSQVAREAQRQSSARVSTRGWAPGWKAPSVWETRLKYGSATARAIIKSPWTNWWWSAAGPATPGLIDESAGVVLTERGHVQVDEQCRTSAEGVWAIGDLVRGPMLAHKALKKE